MILDIKNQVAAQIAKDLVAAAISASFFTINSNYEYIWDQYMGFFVETYQKVLETLGPTDQTK
jgi:hypothetical protein